MKRVGTLVMVAIALGGCGRLGFEPLTDTGEAVESGADGAGGSGASSDASDGSSGAGGARDGAAGDADASSDATGQDAVATDAGPSDTGSTDADADRMDADAGPTCRAGCSCEWYFGHRYMLCPDKVVFTAARAACTSFGMRLVRVNSGQEHSFLRLRSQQDGDAKFHIGATDVAQEGMWVWEDGTQFWSGGSAGMAVNSKFALWQAGEPNNQNGNENCGETQSIQGWNDSVCDGEAKPFICEAYPDPRPQCGDSIVQAGETCDDGTATPTCDQDCSPVACGDGVVNVAAGEVCDDGSAGQYCSADCKQIVCPPGCQCFTGAGNDYALCATGAAFRDAEVFCGQHGMALASVMSATEDQALRTQATNAGVADYWIGGTDQDADGKWLWMSTARFWSGTASGSALGYAHFAATAPNGGNALNCLHVGANGEWTDANCATSFAYMCERVLP